jgi:hypothetical protein
MRISRLSNFTRFFGLALATLACASGALAAEGSASTEDGILKVSNTTPKPGDNVTVTFTTSAKHTKLSPCVAAVIVRGLDSQNFVQQAPSQQGMVTGGPPQVLTVHLTAPGKYRALVINPSAFPGACGGLPNGTILSSPLQLDFAIAAPLSEAAAKLALGGNGPALNGAAIQAAGMGVSAPGTCPSGYDYTTSGVDTSKGEFYCVKKWEACPAGYTQTVNDNTGQIVCTPNAPPSCPTGWTGGLADAGKLVCNPIAQPVIACGDSPRKSEGYYLQYLKYQNPGWNRMGCMALQQLK